MGVVGAGRLVGAAALEAAVARAVVARAAVARAAAARGDAAATQVAVVAESRFRRAAGQAGDRLPQLLLAADAVEAAASKFATSTNPQRQRHETSSDRAGAARCHAPGAHGS